MTRIVKPQHFSSWLFPSQICVCFSHRLLCESEAGNSLDCALSFQLFHYPTHKLNNDALCFFFVFFYFHLVSYTWTSKFCFCFSPRDQETSRRLKNVSDFLFYFIYFIHFHIFYNWLTESHNSHYKYLFQCKDNATYSFIAHIFGRLDKGGRNWETRVIMLHRFTIWMYWLDI